MVDQEPHNETDQQFSGAALSKELITAGEEVISGMTAQQRPEQDSSRDHERLQVVEGLSEVRRGKVELGQDFRFLITATVQSSPSELGTWLNGDGNGFRATERPVNASLIDQEHNWTFAGENGFILAPPEDGADVIAAKPTDIGSNDLDKQSIDLNAEELLKQTSETGYNQVNIASGRLQGVYIRQDVQGQDLGNPRTNEQLRAFAEQLGLPVVELPVMSKNLEPGPAEVEELGTKEGNRLWKVAFPGEGVRREIDIVRFKPGETAKGMQTDAQGFDMRIQELDPYGKSTHINDNRETLGNVRSEVEELIASATDSDREALEFALRRIDNLLEA